MIQSIRQLKNASIILFALLISTGAYGQGSNAPTRRQAPRSQDGNINREFEIKGNVLVKFLGSGGDVTIPDGVTSIGPMAFYDKPIIGIKIPDSVTSIGQDAFFGCDLNSVTIPASVKTIGKDALGYDRAGAFHTPREGFTIYGTRGSAAERYAKNHPFIKFVLEKG